MCIICNLPEHYDEANAVLDTFENARAAMQKAADAMLAASKVGDDPEVSARYDRAHKAMRRVMRDWNRIEELREKVMTPLDT